MRTFLDLIHDLLCRRGVEVVNDDIRAPGSVEKRVAVQGIPYDLVLAKAHKVIVKLTSCLDHHLRR